MARPKSCWPATPSLSFARAGRSTETLPNGTITEACGPTTRPFSQVRSTPSAHQTLHRSLPISAWSGGLKIDDFIAVSKKGRTNGDFIMHRENGTLAEVNLAKGRGIGKMKATITQRFKFDGIECDVDCDCRFIFFTLKQGGEWKTRWAKLFYEKDKVVSVDGKNVPSIFTAEELAKYPEGEC